MPLSKAKLQQYTALLRKKERQKQGLFLAEGYRLVESAQTKKSEIVAIIALAGAQLPVIAKQIPVYQADEIQFAKLSDTETAQGIVAVCKIPPSPPISEFSRVLFLDNIQDPGNMGTLIRTAAWFGLEAVIANRSVDFYNPKAVRSTMGGIWDIPCLDAPIESLSAAGFTLVGADMKGKSFQEWTPAPKVALVLGNEGNGLSEAVRPYIKEFVTINGANAAATESLNVAVAGGILMAKMVAPN